MGRAKLWHPCEWRYGDALLDGKSNQGALMLQLITQFANNYCDAIDGTSAQVQEA